MTVLRALATAVVVVFWIFHPGATGASAHPGNTAADGCHYCRTNCDSWGVPWNERHCHGGSSEPAPTSPPPTEPPPPTTASPPPTSPPTTSGASGSGTVTTAPPTTTTTEPPTTTTSTTEPPPGPPRVSVVEHGDEAGTITVVITGEPGDGYEITAGDEVREGSLGSGGDAEVELELGPGEYRIVVTLERSGKTSDETHRLVNISDVDEGGDSPVAGFLVLGALGGGGYWWWRRRKAGSAPVAPPPPPAPPAA